MVSWNALVYWDLIHKLEFQHLIWIQTAIVFLKKEWLVAPGVMHGLPCSALQHCFGGPPDVSADPAPYPDPELCKTGSDPATGPVVLTQPGPVKPTRTDSQPSMGCISIQTKTNGTHSKTKEPNADHQHTLHSYPSSEGLSEDDDVQDNSPVLDTKRPHIPRPSIIRPQKVRALCSYNILAEFLSLVQWVKLLDDCTCIWVCFEVWVEHNNHFYGY